MLNLSHSFVLSAGTVSIDLSKNLVLILYHCPTGKFSLPKGRKNAGESLENAAIRETMEESGYKCTLLNHSLPTNVPDLQQGLSFHREPIAVQQRMNGNVRKIIFWYAAEADSSDQQVKQEGEEFETYWVNSENATTWISFAEDREIVNAALEAARFTR